MSSSHLLDPFILQRIKRNKIILDVACGKGKWGFLIRIEQSPRRIVGVDIWLPNLYFVKHHRIYDEVIRCDVRALPFRDTSFDLTLCCEVLEHLSKENGSGLLDEVCRITREKVIVTTPNVWIDTDTEFNPYQKHVTLYRPKELRKKGFKVRGIGFSLFGHQAPPKLTAALLALGYIFPEMSWLILAEKNMT